MDLKERKQAKLSGFRGVDFSSSPLLVAQNRAVKSTNFIFENGVNRKRHGWIEKLRIGTGNINGIFECSLNNQKLIIVYAEKSFYKVTLDNETGKYIVEDITNTSTNVKCKVNQERLLDKRCQMFVNNNRLYFIGCGDYLTYGMYNDKFELRRVEDDDNTYIPTTSINGDADSVEGGKSEKLENPNLLCSKRKNTFVGNAANSTFTLDSQSIDEDVQVVINHETLDVAGNLITKTYLSNNELLYDEEGSVVGTIDFEKAKVTLNIDTKPVLEEESNLTIVFSCKVEDYANRINNADIGIMFGVNGNPDRLFVTGNEKYPNNDFYSEMDNLTYFGDSNVSAIGSSDSKIMGYSRLGDGTLATHKEEVNGEASIYYRTGTYETKYKEDGSIDNITSYFPIQAGTIGEAMISKYANANLSGDKLFLSKNGVYGIVLTTNMTSTERFSKERSQYINDKLKQHKDLSEAVAIAYDNKYFLAVDNVCYIADARMTSRNTSDTNSFNYEWFYWENMPVRVWGVIDGELFFGTSDGRICTFDDEYIDRVYTKTETNDLLIDYDSNKIFFNTDLKLKNKDIINFDTNVFKEKLTQNQIIKVENNRIYISDTDILLFYNSTEVYADCVEDSGIQPNVKYYIDDINLVNCSFRLKDENGNQVEIYSKNFRLCENLKNIELIVTNVGLDYFNVSYSEEDSVISLIKYNDSQEYQTPTATFVIKTNVIASWYSPIFDFGTNQAMKTLLTLTISTEPTTNGQIDFGYLAKDSEASIEAEGINMFDFETLDFNNFTFDTSFANSYTIDIKDYFNFIQFFFKSDNEYACVVHSMTITYKINSMNKGVQ